MLSAVHFQNVDPVHFHLLHVPAATERLCHGLRTMLPVARSHSQRLVHQHPPSALRENERLHIPLERRRLERIPKVSSLCIDLCAVFKQQSDDGMVPTDRCRLERVSIVSGPCVRIRPLVEQQRVTSLRPSGATA